VRRADFDHVIAAAADVTGETEFIVIGSQAIIGSFPDAPATLLRSQEADLYPRRDPDKFDQIDGALGDGSWFHRTYGYYAHGVGPETANAPKGWEERLIRVEIAARVSSRRGAVALCLEPHDLVLAKCVADRERDWDFAREALHHGLVQVEVLLDRVADIPVGEKQRARIRRMIEGIVRADRATDASA
jgi:hypothetical protein